MKALKGKSLVGSIVHVTMRQMSSRMKISVQAEGILADVGELLGVRKVSSRRSIGKNLRGNTDTGHRERGARVVTSSIVPADKRPHEMAMTRITK